MEFLVNLPERNRRFEKAGHYVVVCKQSLYNVNRIPRNDLWTGLCERKFSAVSLLKITRFESTVFFCVHYACKQMSVIIDFSCIGFRNGIRHAKLSNRFRAIVQIFFYFLNIKVF